jgi:hypothetical protein
VKLRRHFAARAPSLGGMNGFSSISVMPDILRQLKPAGCHA